MKITIQKARTSFYSIRSVQGEDLGEIEVTEDELKFLNKATKKYIRAQKMIANKLPQKEYKEYKEVPTAVDKQNETNKINAIQREEAWRRRVNND